MVFVVCVFAVMDCILSENLWLQLLFAVNDFRAGERHYLIAIRRFFST